MCSLALVDFEAWDFAFGFRVLGLWFRVCEQDVLVSADVDGLLCTASELLLNSAPYYSLLSSALGSSPKATPEATSKTIPRGTVKSEGFWSVFGRRAKDSIHLFSPQDAALVAAALHAHDRDTGRFWIWGLGFYKELITLHDEARSYRHGFRLGRRGFEGLALRYIAWVRHSKVVIKTLGFRVWDLGFRVFRRLGAFVRRS